MKVNVVTPGVLAAVLTILGLGAAYAHYDALSAYFNDPQTATLVMGIISSVGTLIAGILRGVEKKGN